MTKHCAIWMFEVLGILTLDEVSGLFHYPAIFIL
jgi:hypothetical protein